VADAPKLLGTDTLRIAYPKVNMAIDNANAALRNSNDAVATAGQAVETANQALQNSESTQTQLDNIIIENGQSDAEVVQARTKADGTTFPVLRDRLNDVDDKIGILKRIVRSIEDFPRIHPEVTDSPRIQRAIDSLTNGGTIFFPSSTYIISSQVIVKPYVFLKGAEFINLQDRTKQPVFEITVGEGDTTGDPTLSAFRMKSSSGISGFAFYYPNQVDETATTPTAYSWTIDTRKETPQSANTDNVYLENLLFINSYRAINLEDAGRFNISNIYGAPIETGLRVNNVFDVARAKHIHFWPALSYSAGSNIRNWIQNNGTAFDLQHVDQLSAFDLFCYGYNYGFKIGNQFWGDLVSCCADICNRAIYIDNNVDMVRFTGGTFTNNTIHKPVITTNINVNGRVMFSNCSFYGGASVTSVISSNTGLFAFDNCDFKDGTDGSNGWRYSPMIVSGSTEVRVNNCPGFNSRYAIGNSLIINGISRNRKDVDITPANFNMATWTNGVPDNWTVSSSSDIAQITNGVQLILNNAVGTRVLKYTIPTNIKAEKDFYIIELDFESFASNDQFRIYFSFCRDDGTNFAVRYGTTYCLSPNGKVTLKMPFYLGEFPDLAIFRIEWQAYGTCTGNLQLTNLKWYKSQISKHTNHQLEYTFKDIFLDPYGKGIVTKREGLNKVIYDDAPPTAGTWSLGDKHINTVPTAGGYEGWVCTTAGTPGTWKGYGAIQT